MKHRLVLIEWEDSAQPVPSWQWLSAYEEPYIVKCRSVGWLIHDGERVKALAPNLGTLDDEDAQVSGVIRIPAKAVTAIKPILLQETEKAVIEAAKGVLEARNSMHMNYPEASRAMIKLVDAVAALSGEDVTHD